MKASSSPCYPFASAQQAHWPSGSRKSASVSRSSYPVPVQDSETGSKIPAKLTKKRPFGSIRCRACNRYGLTNQCACSPMARYSVMIQSKRISKQQQRQIRRLSFATVKEAETFRQYVAMQCFSRPAGFYSSNLGGYDASYFQNQQNQNSIEEGFDPYELGPLLEPESGRNAWEDNSPMLQRSQFINKRPMCSSLDCQPTAQRKRIRLNPGPFVPMAQPTSRAHPMIGSWQTPAVPPMPQQYTPNFKPFSGARDAKNSIAPSANRMGSPNSPIDSPITVNPPSSIGVSVAAATGKGALKKLMIDVVAACLAQRAP